MIKKVKNNVPWTYVINDINGKDIVGTYFVKELQNTHQKEFRFEKLVKREGDILYVRWKEYNNSLDSWIDKKYSIND